MVYIKMQNKEDTTFFCNLKIEMQMCKQWCANSKKWHLSQSQYTWTHLSRYNLIKIIIKWHTTLIQLIFTVRIGVSRRKEWALIFIVAESTYYESLSGDSVLKTINPEHNKIEIITLNLTKSWFIGAIHGKKPWLLRWGREKSAWLVEERKKAAWVKR